MKRIIIFYVVITLVGLYSCLGFGSGFEFVKEGGDIYYYNNFQYFDSPEGNYIEQLYAASVDPEFIITQKDTSVVHDGEYSLRLGDADGKHYLLLFLSDDDDMKYIGTMEMYFYDDRFPLNRYAIYAGVFDRQGATKDTVMLIVDDSLWTEGITRGNYVVREYDENEEAMYLDTGISRTSGWQHVKFVFDGNNTQAFLNGEMFFDSDAFGYVTRRALAFGNPWRGPWGNMWVDSIKVELQEFKE